MSRITWVLKMPGPYLPAQRKIAVIAELLDKIDGKDFAMLRSKGKKKKSMMGRYS